MRRFTVPSPKTEHNRYKATRVIALFAELRPRLEEAQELSGKQGEYPITRYRDAGQNMRTQAECIIQRAAVSLWPKPFQNLRSSRETELAESYPLHVVCAWIGNSEAVARQHYLQVTESQVARAARTATVFYTEPNDPSGGVVTADGNTRSASTPVGVVSASGMVEAKQLVVKQARNGLHEDRAGHEKSPDLPGFAAARLSTQLDEYPYGDSNPGYRTENPMS